MLTGKDAGTADRSGQVPSSVIHSRGFIMDALVILGLFLLLALLAARFGHDSRENLASTEETFARQGFLQPWHGDRS